MKRHPFECVSVGVAGEDGVVAMWLLSLCCIAFGCWFAETHLEPERKRLVDLGVSLACASMLLLSARSLDENLCLLSVVQFALVTCAYVASKVRPLARAAAVTEASEASAV